MRPRYRFTKREAREHIARVLKVKISDDGYVNRLSTLHRIKEWVSKDLIYSQYSNDTARVGTVDDHSWVDIWVGDRLLTIRHKTKLWDTN